MKGQRRCSYVGEAASVGVGILTSGKPTAVAAAALSLAESRKEAGGGVKATDANHWRYRGDGEAVQAPVLGSRRRSGGSEAALGAGWRHTPVGKERGGARVVALAQETTNSHSHKQQTHARARWINTMKTNTGFCGNECLSSLYL